MSTWEECNCDVELKNGLNLAFDFKKDEIEEAVRVLLKGLGEDINREGIVKTPHRVAKALLDATRGYKESVDDIVQGALFPESGLDNNLGQAGGVGGLGLVIVRDLDLFSHCESCLLPFHVKCHIGYVPKGQRVVGLSKLSRVANVFAKRFQEPQRLANEICTSLQDSINPAGVAVLLQSFHIVNPNSDDSWSLGTNSAGFVKKTVLSGSGVFGDDQDEIWREFFSLLKYNYQAKNKKKNDYWCPLITTSVSTNTQKVHVDMVNAVRSIIRSLGEDPLRKKLVKTPERYVKWLINFENCDIKSKLNGYISNKNSENGISNGNMKKMNFETNLPFLSQCEHHLLPFHGMVHIGYFNYEPVNKSLLQSIVHFFGFKLQVQERCTRQIAEVVSSLVGGDVIVVVEASHTCMISRGIEKFGSSTATIAVLGRFSTDAKAKALFLESLSIQESP